jgi:hypothetical protein
MPLLCFVQTCSAFLSLVSITYVDNFYFVSDFLVEGRAAVEVTTASALGKAFMLDRALFV